MIATADYLDRFSCNARPRPCIDVADFLAVLGSRRFVRAPLHSSRPLEMALRRSLHQQTALRIVILWGKGRKPLPDSYESRTATFLAKYAKRIESVWPAGVRFHVLFADTHAALNGYGATEAFQYFAAVRSVLGEHNTFGTLSHLWQEGGLTWQELERRANEIDQDEWDELDARLKLVAAASRFSLRGNPERLARLYFATRKAENRLLSMAFSGCLFGTTEGPERHPVLPDLPVLHIYSWARGRCAKPWNVTDGELVRFETARELESCAA